MAILMTNSIAEWGGGLAYVRGACNAHHQEKVHYGSLIFNDDGTWGSLTVGAHEMGHTLGAHHDDHPGFSRDCDGGYIMKGGSDDFRYFFSPCSNQGITDFVRSDQASCLRKRDHGGSLPISHHFSNAKPTSRDEQCKRRENNPNASSRNDNNCKQLSCTWPIQGESSSRPGAILDNTPCTGGRCLRGQCRREGNLIKNVGSGQCLYTTDKFHHRSHVHLVKCVKSGTGTPLERFVVTDNSIGKMLATPFSTKDGKEVGDACIYTGNREGNGMATDRCNTKNDWHGWIFDDVGNGEFLIRHRVTNRCAKQEGSYVTTLSNCDRNDRYMR